MIGIVNIYCGEKILRKYFLKKSYCGSYLFVICYVIVSKIFIMLFFKLCYYFEL